MPTAPRRDFFRRLYVSRTHEGTFGTAETLTHTMDAYLNSGILGIQTMVQDDSDVCTGREFPQRQFVMDNMLRPVRLEFPATCANIGMIFGHALQAGSVAAEGGAGAYLHEYLPSTVNNSVNGWTIQEQMLAAKNAATDRKHSGLYIASCGLTAGRTGHVRVFANVRGIGKNTAATDVTESGTTNTADVRFSTKRVKVTLQAVSSQNTTPWDGSWNVPSSAGVHANSFSTTLNNDLDSWTLEWFNNPDQEIEQGGAGVASGAALQGNQPVFGPRRARLSLRMKRTSDTMGMLYDLLDSTDAANAQFAFGIEGVSDLLAATGKPYAFGLILPLTHYTQAPEGSPGGIITDQYEFQALQDDDSALDPLYAYIINQEANEYGA